MGRRGVKSLRNICIFRRTPVCEHAGRNVRHAYGEVAYATAAEVSRNFGRWQDQALAGPVVVTHHGRPRVVVVSAQQYEALTLDGAAGAEGEADGARLEEILAELTAFQAASIGGGAIRLSRRGIVAAITETLARGLGLTVDEAIGGPLTELAVPPDRRRLTSALEQCFEDGAPSRIEVSLLGAGEAGIAVRLGLAPLMKSGAVDGLVVAVSPIAPMDGVEIW